MVNLIHQVNQPESITQDVLVGIQTPQPIQKVPSVDNSNEIVKINGAPTQKTIYKGFFMWNVWNSKSNQKGHVQKYPLVKK